MVDYEKGQKILMSAETYNGLVARSTTDVVMRIWSFPSIEPYKSWTVFKDKKNYFLRSIVWDQLAKIFTTDLITYGTEKQVGEDIIDPLLNELESIKIPPFENVNTIGLDGVTSGVERVNRMVSASVNWWCDTPNTWKPLQLWHENAIIQLDKFLPICTTDLK